MDVDRLETIILEREGGMAAIRLNRPEVRNAMNLQMIRELTSTLRILDRDEGTRVILFRSEGAHFCAGADLAWMQAGLEQSEEQLKLESLELAGLFRTLWEAHAVTVCSVKGLIPGGAIGLLAASDLVVAESSSALRFSEVRLGLVPATIAPYVLRKAGPGRSSDWMMTGRLIGTLEARDAGLIHRICEDGKLEEATRELLEELMSVGPRALRGVKQLLRGIEGIAEPREADEYTSGLIAALRKSREGQEGMKAFLEKRKPSWDE